MSEDQVTVLPSLNSFSRGNLFLRGIVLLILGILLLANPIRTVAAMTIVIGIFLIIEAFSSLWLTMKKDKSARNLGLFYSISTLICGILCLVSPLIMDLAWIIVIGFWQLIAGFNYMAATSKATGAFKSLAVINGVISIIIGIIFIIIPFTGLVTMIWLLGVLLLILSLVLIISAFAKK